MPYEYKTDKRGNRHFSRTLARVQASPKAKVTVEKAKAPVEPVETAVDVPTTPKPKAKKSDG